MVSLRIAISFLAILGCYSVVIALPARDVVVNLCPSGYFALTFDQGPGLPTGQVLDALQAHKVKATFHPVVTFLNEAVVVANLQRAADEGHLIGLSLEEDFSADGMSDQDVLSEINSRADLIKQAVGFKPVYLRIPHYDKLSKDTLAFIHSKGYIISTYNIDSYDYSTDDILPSFKQTLDKLSPNTKGGFISVQRDYLDSSAAKTEEVVEYILEKGYKPVTLDQCAKTKIKDAPGPKGLGSVKGRSSSFGPAISHFSVLLAGLLLSLLNM